MRNQSITPAPLRGPLLISLVQKSGCPTAAMPVNQNRKSRTDPVKYSRKLPRIMWELPGKEEDRLSNNILGQPGGKTKTNHLSCLELAENKSKSPFLKPF